MMRNILKYKITLLISAIILFASFLRLYRIQDYMTFLGDEGRDVLVAYNILHGHFTLLGPTASVGGFYFGPIYYYFMAPALFLANYNPVGPAIMVALFGIATVWLVYKFGKEFFSPAVGVLAALLYAISPLVVAYSRSSWNPNPVPFFALLVLWFIYTGLKHMSWKRILLAGIFLGIAIELHFIVAILGISVIAYMLCMIFLQKLSSREKIKQLLKMYLWLGFGFFIGWLPYLGFEVRHGFPNTRSVINFAFHSGKLSGDNTNFFMTIGDVFFRLFGRLLATFPPPEQLKNYPQISIVIWTIFVLFIGIGSVMLLIWQLTHPFFVIPTEEERRAEGSHATVLENQSRNIYQVRGIRFLDFARNDKLLLILCWLFFGVVTFGIYKRQIYDYYFGFMFPLPFLLVGNGLIFLWQKKYFLKSIALIIFGVLVYLNLQGIPFRYPPNRQLQQMETIAQFVNEKTDGKPFNFALITGGNSDHAYRYFFTLWNHPPVTIQNTAVDPQRTSVTGQLFVVCESIPCYPLGNSLFEIAGFGRADIVARWDVSVVEIYKLVHYKGK